MVLQSVRRWRGVTVAVSCATAGPLELPASSQYLVSMLVGSPARAVWRSGAGSKEALRSTGDVDIICPGDPLSVEHDRPSELLNVTLSSEVVTSAAADVGEDVETLAMVSRTHVRDARLQHVAWALKEELASKDKDDLGEILGRALALRLVTVYASPSRDDCNRSRNVDLECMIEYIDEHLDSDLTLAEIARVGCVSVHNLKRLFRETVGLSTHRYVVERRIAYATILLKVGDSPIKDVALQSGFSDQSHMTRWMRRVTGMTPNDVRAH